MNDYYFDQLPVHPHPEPLESFTSYLTRLAEANGIRSIPQLFGLCFPDGQRGFTLSNGDYPPRSFGALPAAVGCSASTLLATTFYHLASKFGRRTNPQPLALFMSGAVSPGLRYCPACLAERGYYALTWRFLELEGCAEHGQRLLDHCQHCGQKIPLLTQPLQVNLCPVCSSDLRCGQAERLTSSAQQKAQACTQDLAFLLSPLRTPVADIPVVKFIGQQFNRWRRVRRLRVSDAAEYMELAGSVVYWIERGSELRTTKFQWYLRYADFLKIRFETMFATPLPPQPEQTLEDALVEKVQQAIVSLEQQEDLVTLQTVAQMIGVSFKIFRNYPKVGQLCTASQARWREQQEAEWINQAQQMVTKMQAETGQPFSKNELYRRLGWSLSKFNTHPHVKTALKQMFEQMNDQYERMIFNKVQAVLAQLEAAGQPITKLAISSMIGVSLKTMYRLPTVNRLLKEQVLDKKPEYEIRKFQRREQKLLLDIQQIIETLRASGQPITRAAIHRLLKRNPSSLELYPRVQVLLKEVTLAKAR